MARLLFSEVGVERRARLGRWKESWTWSDSAMSKARADVGGDLGGGRGGEGEDAGDAEVFGEAGKFEVVGAEVVAPLGDAVGFVDGEEGDVEFVEGGRGTFRWRGVRGRRRGV